MELGERRARANFDFTSLHSRGRHDRGCFHMRQRQHHRRKEHWQSHDMTCESCHRDYKTKHQFCQPVTLSLGHQHGLQCPRCCGWPSGPTLAPRVPMSSIARWKALSVSVCERSSSGLRPWVEQASPSRPDHLNNVLISEMARRLDVRSDAGAKSSR